MAKDLKNNTEKPADTTQELLLTEEEYAKKQRLKTKERINRVTRVAGLFAILILVYTGILDPIFELSYFGWIWDKIAKTNVFEDGWAFLRQSTIYDDIFEFGPWIAQLGLTVVLIAVIVLMVYFITYCIVDLVDLVRTFVATGRDTIKDLSGNVKDTMPDELKEKKEKRKKEKKSLFSKEEIKEAKPKKERKKRESDNLAGLSESELDALLSGKNLEEPASEDELNLKDNEEKTLF